jgi:hypothetical protein
MAVKNYEPKKNTATYPCDYAGIDCGDNGLL